MIGDQTFTELPAVIEFYRKHFLDTTTLNEHVSIFCSITIMIVTLQLTLSRISMCILFTVLMIKLTDEIVYMSTT